MQKRKMNNNNNNNNNNNSKKKKKKKKKKKNYRKDCYQLANLVNKRYRRRDLIFTDWEI